MLQHEPTFPQVSLLVTHYNRSKSLERLLDSFNDIKCQFGEIVVSDDGSEPYHLEYLNELQKQFSFKLITTPENRGLGNNINKGQEAVTKSFTLYVQEDFVPQLKFKEALTAALDYMKTRPSLDMVRFYAYFKYPYLESLGDGFGKMIFKLIYPGYLKFYAYSDHPHLRRSSFLEKFGKYSEGDKGDVTEYKMMLSFLKNGGEGLFYEDYKSLFHQVNSSTEPSTMIGTRNYWRESNNFLVRSLRHIYRHVKFNLDYLK